MRVRAIALVLAAAGSVCGRASGGLYPPAPGPHVAIVDRGRPKAVISIPAEPSEFVRFAASELAATIEQISGAKLPTVTGQSQEPVFTIWLGAKARAGRVAWDGLGRDGFVIRSAGDGLAICGNTDIGTVYGVYAFLEEHLGCRWFAAHKLGTVTPKMDTIRVGRIVSVQKPDYRFRHIGGMTLNSCGLKNRLSERVSVAGKRYGKVWGTAHTFARLLPTDQWHGPHPEYFAQVGPARKHPIARKSHGPQICTSTPEAARATARAVLDVFRSDPLLEMVTVGPNDGLLFCECRRCRALDEARGTWTGSDTRPAWRGVLSRRMITFYNTVAEQVAAAAADKLVKVMFYSWYQTPPSDPSLRLAPNTLLMLTHSGNPTPLEPVAPSCYNHAIDDPACRPNRERFFPALKGWASRAPRLGIYEYYHKASVCHVLFPIVHTIRRDVPTYHRLGARYFYTQGSGSNAGSYLLNYYVTAKLLWNINTDVDALIDDFCEKYYQAASAAMGEYHRLLEEWMATQGGDVLGWPFYTTTVFAPANVARARALLDQATARADDDVVRERIRLQRVALRYAELCRDLAALAVKASGSLRQEAYWQGITSANAESTVAAIAAKQAEIRKFMTDHATDRSIGTVAGNYVKRWLAPTVVALAPGEQSMGKTLQRPEWAAREGRPAKALPESCDLWIYGNDLDGSPTESEHELHAVGPDGAVTKLADFPSREQVANRRNGLCIVENLALRSTPDGEVRLVVTNKPGHWSSSTLFAFYLMEPRDRLPIKDAQTLVERNRDMVRDAAVAFVELPYRGVRNGDGRPTPVVLKLR